MIAKSLIAASAVAASLVAFAPAQEAQAGVDIDVHFGVPGYYPYYPVYPVYPVVVDPWYGAISCKKGKNIVKWSGFSKVNAVDCSLPGYKYTGWKYGHKYLVKVSGSGDIYSVHRIF
jgi:hypothetical protein